MNSKAYSEEHSVAYLLENVAGKLSYNIDFERIPYPRDLIVTTTKQKLIVKLKRERHQEAAEKRKMEGIK